MRTLGEIIDRAEERMWLGGRKVRHIITKKEAMTDKPEGESEPEDEDDDD